MHEIAGHSGCLLSQSKADINVCACAGVPEHLQAELVLMSPSMVHGSQHDELASMLLEGFAGAVASSSGTSFMIVLKRWNFLRWCEMDCKLCCKKPCRVILCCVRQRLPDL